MEKKLKKKSKPEKTIKPCRLPYPDGLFVVLGVNPPINEDQLEGLQYLMMNLKAREREIFHMRYEEHMTYKAIGEKYGLSSERIKTLHNRAVQKIKRSENASYYQEGYVKTLMRIQEEKEQQEKQAVKTIIDFGECSIDISQIRVCDMNMTTRTVNCLIRSDLYMLADVFSLIKKDPASLSKKRGLGKVSYNELVMKLLEYGIKAEAE